jgi:hypothetical protein
VSLALGVAVAGCAVAALALLVSLAVWRRLRDVRRGQQAILGGSSADVVEFAVSLQAPSSPRSRAATTPGST